MFPLSIAQRLSWVFFTIKISKNPTTAHPWTHPPLHFVFPPSLFNLKLKTPHAPASEDCSLREPPQTWTYERPIACLTTEDRNGKRGGAGEKEGDYHISHLKVYIKWSHLFLLWVAVFTNSKRSVRRKERKKSFFCYFYLTYSIHLTFFSHEVCIVTK